MDVKYEDELLKSFISEEYYKKIFGPTIYTTELFKRNLSNFRYIFIIGLGILGFILGYIGYYKKFSNQPNLQNPINIVFYVIKLFFFDIRADPPLPWELEVAKYLCPIALFYSAIKAFLTLFQEELTLFYLQFFRNHVVICGLNKWGSQLASDFCANGEKVVIIGKDMNSEFIMKCRDFGAIVLIGNYTDPYMLYKARVHHAKYLIAFTYDDSINMDIGINARKIIKEKYPKKSYNNSTSTTLKKKLSCFIHITDIQFLNSFYQHQIFSKKSANFEIRFFNIYKNNARTLFLTFPIDNLVDTCAKNIQIHLLVIGFGQMGESVVLQAAQIGHYANGEKLRITVIDKDAENLESQFQYRYPNFSNILSINFISIDIDNQNEFNKMVPTIDKDHAITAIIICLENSELTIKLGLALTSIFKSRDIPIRVHLDENVDIFTFVDSYPISPFGLIMHSCSREIVVNEVLDRFAKTIHNYYIKSEINKQITRNENPSLVPWDELPIDLKDSNRQQADHIPIKLRALDYRVSKIKGKKPADFDFNTEEIDILARIEHNRWCANRWLAGWTYNRDKNIEKKISPDLIPYDDLTPYQKEKDWKAIKNIPKLLCLIELEIQKEPIKS
jgi:hypothetical protein